MLTVIAATAGANSHPSTLTTLLTALGGALVGGLISAAATLVVEGRRAHHERDLADARFVQEAQALDREGSALLQAAARMLDNELVNTRAMLLAAVERKEWWTEHWGPPRASADERRVLARHLDADRWFLVVMAEGLTTAAFASAAMAGPEAEMMTFQQDGLRATVAALGDAIEALSSVTGRPTGQLSLWQPQDPPAVAGSDPP